MIDYTHLLSSAERLALHAGLASYPCRSVRSVAIGIALIAAPASVDGMTGTVYDDVTAISIAANAINPYLLTVRDVRAAMVTLIAMDVLHPTTQTPVLLFDCAALVPRADAVLDLIDPATGRMCA